MTRRTLLTALLVALLPALTGLAIVSSAATPSEIAAAVPAAVVNLDSPATTADGTTLPAGRLLLGRLTDPPEALTADPATASSSDPGPGSPDDPGDYALDYSVVSADTAADGLADGTYDVVITIPADFSSSVAATLDGAPAQAQVRIQTSQAADSTAAAAGQSAVQAAVASLGTTVSQAYVSGSLQATGTLASSLEEAAAGAASLAQGVGSYTDGVDSLRAAVTTPDAATGYDLAGGARAASEGAAQAYSLCVASHGASDPTCQALAQVSGATSAVSGAVGSGSDVYDPSTGGGSTVVGVVNALSARSSGLASGATSLSEGLAEATGALPSYDEDEAAAMAEAVTQPVAVEASGMASGQAADDLVPAASATALWVGALVAVSGLGVMSRRDVESAATPARLAWRSLRPALVLAVVQALVLTAVLAAAGVGPGSHLGTVVAAASMLVVGAVAMTLLHAALTAGLGGRVGTAASLLALVLQVAALGGATTGAAEGVLSAVQAAGPLNLLATALRTCVLGGAGAGGAAGGTIAGVAACVAALVCWAGASGLAVVLAVRRRRSTSVAELRGQLAARYPAP